MVNVSLEQVSNYYHSLKTSAATIFIIGEMSPGAKQNRPKRNQPYQSRLSLSNASAESIIYEPLSTVIQKNEGDLWQTRSAMALMPVSSVKEWISLQLWGTDLVSTLNKQQHIDFVQLASNTVTSASLGRGGIFNMATR